MMKLYARRLIHIHTIFAVHLFKEDRVVIDVYVQGGWSLTSSLKDWAFPVKFTYTISSDQILQGTGVVPEMFTIQPEEKGTAYVAE